MTGVAEQNGRDGDRLDVQMLHGIVVTDDPDHRAGLADHERRQAITGTPEQIIEELNEFAEVGLTQIVCTARLPGRPNSLESTLEGIEWVMTEIAPQVH